MQKRQTLRRATCSRMSRQSPAAVSAFCRVGRFLRKTTRKRLAIARNALLAGSRLCRTACGKKIGQLHHKPGGSRLAKGTHSLVIHCKNYSSIFGFQDKKNVQTKLRVTYSTGRHYIAAIPWAGANRARAFMMKVENAKKIPDTSPQPSAATSVRTRIGSSIFVERGRILLLCLRFDNPSYRLSFNATRRTSGEILAPVTSSTTLRPA